MDIGDRAASSAAFGPPASSLTPLSAICVALNESSVASHGFLPALVPTASLGAAFARHIEACAELPQRYHDNGADVRPWLRDTFADWDRDAAAGLSDHELDGAMTAVSMLAHAYRWGAMPASKNADELSQLLLPPGLGLPLAWLAKRLDIPPCGTFYHLVVANWRMPELTPGAAYDAAALLARIEDLSPLHGWLRAPEAAHLTETVRCIVATEAWGVAIVAAVAQLLEAAARDDVGEAAALLDKLCILILEVARVLGRSMRPQKISPEVFLSVIQPHFAWGLPHQGQRLDGASGAQTAIIQFLDSTFGVRRTSPLGHVILRSRSYLPSAQRRVLDVVDTAGPLLRSFIEQRTNREVKMQWNECVKSLQSWRKAHQKRGTMYLRTGSNSYRSVSGVIAPSDPHGRASAFESAMEEHARETSRVVLTVDDQQAGLPTDHKGCASSASNLRKSES